jgi:hypothetical protein
MGQAITTTRDTYIVENASKQDAAAAYVLEQLSFLVNAANSKLDKYQSDLNEMWLDSNGTTAKKMVPGRRALRWERGYRVGVSQRDNLFLPATTEAGPTVPPGPPRPPRFDETLGEIVELYFRAGVTGKNGDTVIAGFKKHVLSSLHFILSNTNAGEQEDQRFFVFVQHNAIIRIDVKVWRYNFNSNKVMANAQDVLAYLFCVSVVNHMDLSVDELTYLLSEHAGDADVKEYVDYLLSVWKKIYEIKKEVNTYKYEWEVRFSQIKQEEVRKSLGYQQTKYLDAPPLEQRQELAY